MFPYGNRSNSAQQHISAVSLLWKNINEEMRLTIKLRHENERIEKANDVGSERRYGFNYEACLHRRRAA